MDKMLAIQVENQCSDPYPRNHVKPWKLVCTCKSRGTLNWQAETEESLEASGLASMAYTIIKTLYLNKKGGRCRPISRCIQHNTCTHTHIHCKLTHDILACGTLAHNTLAYTAQ